MKPIWWVTVQFKCTQGQLHVEKFWQRGDNPDEICNLENLALRLLELGKYCPIANCSLRVVSLKRPDGYITTRKPS